MTIIDLLDFIEENYNLSYDELRFGDTVTEIDKSIDQIQKYIKDIHLNLKYLSVENIEEIKGDIEYTNDSIDSEINNIQGAFAKFAHIGGTNTIIQECTDPIDLLTHEDMEYLAGQYIVSEHRELFVDAHKKLLKIKKIDDIKKIL